MQGGRWLRQKTCAGCLAPKKRTVVMLRTDQDGETVVISLYASLNRWSPYVLSLLRVVVALLFLQHGLSKFFNFPTAYPGTLSSLLVAQGLIEVIGSLLLLIGLWSRIVAFILSGDMAVGYFMVHAPRSAYPLANGGDLAVVFCFVFLYIAFAGGGPWSADRAVVKFD